MKRILAPSLRASKEVEVAIRCGEVSAAVELCYRDSVKNITVTVSDDVYRGARIRAAEEGTSVSALVSEYLGQISSRSLHFARLEARQEELRATIGQFRAADRVGRDEVHGRTVR